MNHLEGHYDCLRSDEHHLIASHCDPRTLCALMQTNKTYFYLYVADRAWVAQRKRILARFPGLKALFDAHTCILCPLLDRSYE